MVLPAQGESGNLASSSPQVCTWLLPGQLWNVDPLAARLLPQVVGESLRVVVGEGSLEGMGTESRDRLCPRNSGGGTVCELKLQACSLLSYQTSRHKTNSELKLSTL